VCLLSTTAEINFAALSNRTSNSPRSLTLIKCGRVRRILLCSTLPLCLCLRLFLPLPPPPTGAGPPRCCAHRCEHTEECSYTLTRSHLATAASSIMLLG
jgi:hypothetical protein